VRRRGFIRRSLCLVAAVTVTPEVRPSGRYCQVRDGDTFIAIVRRAYPWLSARERLEQARAVSAANSDVPFVPCALVWLPACALAPSTAPKDGELAVS
jgi:hypothetical protein